MGSALCVFMVPNLSLFMLPHMMYFTAVDKWMLSRGGPCPGIPSHSDPGMEWGIGLGCPRFQWLHC